jgi:hypothetical protein
VKLLHVKVYTQMSNKSVNMISAVLRETFLIDVIQLDYIEDCEVVMFRCHWLVQEECKKMAI